MHNLFYFYLQILHIVIIHLMALNRIIYLSVGGSNRNQNIGGRNSGGGSRRGGVQRGGGSGGGSGGRGGARGRKAVPTAEQLDAELDAYVKEIK